MTPRTLRRKLQKKKKRKEYTPCVKCGERVECRVGFIQNAPDTKEGEDGHDHDAAFSETLYRWCKACNHVQRLTWTGKPG